MAKFCSICSKSITEQVAGELLDKNIEDIIDDLNITLVDVTSGVDRYICQSCYVQVHCAFDFKCTCIYSEDLLDPYINESNTKVNLKEIYKREVEMLDDNNDDEVCRLCMKLCGKDSVVLLSMVLEQPSYVELFGKYIPQVNLDAVDKPVVCKKCLHNLGEFGRFIHPTMKIELDIDILDQKQESTDRNTEVNESRDMELAVRIMSDEEEMDMCNRLLGKFKFELAIAPEAETDESNSTGNKTFEDSNNGAVNRIFECMICGLQTPMLAKVMKHFRDHIPIKPLKCTHCEYKTYHEQRMINHQKTHTICPFIIPCLTCSGAKPIQFQGHICIKCRHLDADGRVKILDQLSVTGDFFCKHCPAKLQHTMCHLVHETNHLKTNDMKCKCCMIEFHTKKAMEQHVSLSGLRCNFCGLVTKCKTQYDNHVEQHSVQNWCEYCKQDVSCILRHSVQLSKKLLYKCRLCKYRAPCLNIMKVHTEVVHTKCERQCCICIFKSRYIRGFKRHMERHRKTGCIFYSCQICHLVAKEQSSIDDHMISVHSAC